MGSLLLDRFRVHGRLGEGGYSIVYRVTDTGSGDDLALKIFKAGVWAPSAVRERSMAELEISRRVDHPHVLRIHEVFDLEDTCALTMDHVPGRDLGRFIDAGGPLPAGRALAVAARICEGLGAVHAEGIVHRDLKPGNVLMGDRGVLKICDFGTALAGPENGVGPGLDVLRWGSPEYMAPEQMDGEAVDARADLYSLGAILYEMLSGIPPFDALLPDDVCSLRATGAPRPLVCLVPGLPPGIEALVERAMSRDRNQRFADTEEFRVALLRNRDAIRGPGTGPS